MHETRSCSHSHLYDFEIIPLTLPAFCNNNYIPGMARKTNLFLNQARGEGSGHPTVTKIHRDEEGEMQMKLADGSD